MTFKPSNSVVAGALALSFALHAAALPGIEIETFDDGVFNNPVFSHEIEFDLPCCWSIENCETFAPVGPPPIGVCVLHLRPNTDLITFNLKPGEVVHSFSIEIQDFEGGFVGTSPSSAVVVRGVTGDFVALHATSIGVQEVVSANASMPGQLTGEPIGHIISAHLQVANEGNAIFPTMIGAFFDDITIDVISPAIPGDANGDGAVNVDDLIAVILAWGPCPPKPAVGGCPADIEPFPGGDGDVDVDDLIAVILNWGA
jgi:hypothetical protein